MENGNWEKNLVQHESFYMHTSKVHLSKNSVSEFKKITQR